jgi:hypothetical protein
LVYDWSDTFSSYNTPNEKGQSGNRHNDGFDGEQVTTICCELDEIW